jgi:hypothetical protein
VIHHILSLDICATLANGNDQLDLVVQVVGQRGVGNGAGRITSRIRRLGEKERGFAVRIIAHLTRVRFRGAANAEYAAHRGTRI